MEDELYREHILDHYKHPRNAGHLDDATHAARGTLSVGAKACDAVLSPNRCSCHAVASAGGDRSSLAESSIENAQCGGMAAST